MRPVVLVSLATSLVGGALPAQRRGASHHGAVLDSGPPATIAGEFRGYHDGSFEYSRFVPCRERSGIPARHPLRTGAGVSGVWMTVVDTAGMPRRPWPTRQITAPQRLDGRSYVRVRGTLVGPGRYGHFGLAPYELRVDSVLRVARAGPRGC